MSDKMRVLAYMEEHGSITPLEALNAFGCMRLGARIWDLKHDGHDIVKTMIYDIDQFGEPMRYAEYRLQKTH